MAKAISDAPAMQTKEVEENHNGCRSTSAKAQYWADELVPTAHPGAW